MIKTKCTINSITKATKEGENEKVLTIESGTESFSVIVGIGYREVEISVGDLERALEKIRYKEDDDICCRDFDDDLLFYTVEDDDEE